MTKWIRRTKGAKLLGVSTPTMARYCEMGLISYRKAGDTSYQVDEDEVLKFRNTHFSYIKRQEQATETVLKELRRKEYEANRELKVLKKFIASLNFLNQRLIKHHLVKHLYADMFNHHGEEIDSKRIDIVQFIINDKHSIKDTCDYFNISKHYTYDLFSRVIGKLSRNTKHLPTIKEENVILSRKVRKQHDHICTLMSEVQTLRKKLNLFKDYPNPDMFSNVRNNCRDFQFDSSSGLSVRTLNCLQYVHVYNLEQLLSIKKESLKNIRNYGKKCQYELDNFIRHLSTTNKFKDIHWEIYGSHDYSFYRN